MLIYLASPYAHKSKEVMASRARASAEAAARLMAQGYPVFAPIPYGDRIKDYLPDNLQVDHRFWLHQDAAYLFAMTELYVLKLDGWAESKGVRWEIQTAEVLGVPIKYIEA